MPNPIYPAALWQPGSAAGYTLTYDHADGHNVMQWGKAHFTVGTDSTGRGLEGYFQFLVSRGGIVTQFAEADAYCMDSGEANSMGPGIEVEYLPDTDTAIFTDLARAACAFLIKWLGSEWGIPLQYHDGGHDMTPTPGVYAGFLSHRSIIQTEEHSDYWPQADWDLMIATPAPTPVPVPTPTEDEDDMPQLKAFRVKYGDTQLICLEDPKNGRYSVKLSGSTEPSLEAYDAAGCLDLSSKEVNDKIFDIYPLKK